MQFASPWNSAFTCFTQFHRTPIDNNAMTNFIIETEVRQLRRYDFLVILDHSRNDEVCSFSFIQNGLRNVTRENSISNSNVVLNGTCHEFDSCKV